MKKSLVVLLLLLLTALSMLLVGRSADIKTGRIQIFSEKGRAQPVFSVILPTYNRAAYLPRAISSVQGQTFTDFELIIVDDGSTDNTKEVVRRFQENDPRIIYIDSGQNYGVSHARNLALQTAKGKYISILDSDDMFFPTLLASEYRYMEENSDMAAVTARPYQLSEDGTTQHYDGEVYANPVMLLFDNEMVHVGAALRRDFLMQNHIQYDENWHAAEDYKLWAEILIHGGKITMLDQYLTAIRFHSTGSKAYYEEMNTRSAEVRKMLQEHFASNEKNPCRILKKIDRKETQFAKNDIAKAKFLFCSGDYAGMYFIVEEADGRERIFVENEQGRYCEINTHQCGRILNQDNSKIVMEYEDHIVKTYLKKDPYLYQNLSKGR